ncbi:MAG: hypothetical protein H0X50_09455 [Nitrosopumilus sp.]|nr:hypothetical protein [Nitrosopumilus sp.]
MVTIVVVALLMMNNTLQIGAKLWPTIRHLMVAKAISIEWCMFDVIQSVE